MRSMLKQMANGQWLTWKNAGFTLVEMMVTIVILLLVTMGGLAAYNGFNDKQKVSGAAQEFAVFLREAQKRIKSGDKPAGCGTNSLDDYRVTIQNSASPARIYAYCGGGTVLVDSFTLPSGLSFGLTSSPMTVIFSGLTGGASPASVFKVRMGNQIIYQIDVEAGGVISEPIDVSP